VRHVRAHAAWIVVLVALVAAWHAWVRLRGVPQYVLPAPTDVARTLWDERGPLASAAGVTAREMLAGFALALAFGLAAAIALHASPTMRRAVYPLVVASQAVPVVVFAPVLAFWLGFGLLPKLAVIALVSFFSIVVTTTAGFATVDPDLIKLMRTFDAPRRRTFWHVELPTALPGVFTGVKIAVAVSVIGAVFAEWNGSNSGLGYVILQSLPQLLAARGVAAVVILSVFAIALFSALAVAERLAVPWAYGGGEERAR